MSTDETSTPGRERLLEGGVALAVFLLGVVVLWQTREIRVSPMNAKIGPRMIPYIVGSGLILVGLWYAVELVRGQGDGSKGGEDAEDVDVDATTDWATVGWIGLSLVVYLILLERAGFVVASSLLFFGSAFGMGSRRFTRDAAVAVVLSVLVYLLFTRGLSLRLPEGIVPLFVSLPAA